MKDPCQGTSLKKRKDTVDTLQNLEQKLDMRINQATDASKPAPLESRKNSNLNQKVIDYMKESINLCLPKTPTARCGCGCGCGCGCRCSRYRYRNFE